MRVGLISLAVLIPIFIAFSAIGKKMKMENRDIFVTIGYSLICGILSFIFISFIIESSEDENEALHERIEELEVNCAKEYRQ